MTKESQDHVDRLSIDTFPDACVGDDIVLPESTAHHARVLRLQNGSTIQLFDGRGNRADSVVRLMQQNQVVCTLLKKEYIPIPKRRVVLLQAIPKASKIERIVQSTTELGVHAIFPVVTERSTVRKVIKRSQTKTDRLRRIALEACARSGQAHVPHLHQPTDLLSAAAFANNASRRLVFWEESRRSLDNAMYQCFEPCLQSEEEIWVVVGPEGGLSASEINALAETGFFDTSIGNHTLRVETAASLVVGILLDRLGRYAVD